jgi:hypothetical protein
VEEVQIRLVVLIVAQGKAREGKRRKWEREWRHKRQNT